MGGGGGIHKPKSTVGRKQDANKTGNYVVIAQDWTIVVMVKMRGTLSSRLKDTNTGLRLADEILSSLTFTM